MNNSLRVATWNLDRPGFKTKYRLKPQLEILEAIKADILILSTVAIALGDRVFSYREQQPRPLEKVRLARLSSGVRAQTPVPLFAS